MRHPWRRPRAARWTHHAIAWFTALLIGALAFKVAHAAPVPDFKLELLDGKTISLQDYRGKPVLINFFHSK
jgi:cytochrome oxidase Cu insertion factor (SCO1/SenC/PrrC family)